MLIMAREIVGTPLEEKIDENFTVKVFHIPLLRLLVIL